MTVSNYLSFSDKRVNAITFQNELITLIDDIADDSPFLAIALPDITTKALSTDVIELGGPGSGNYRHRGRPGKVGGSQSRRSGTGPTLGRGEGQAQEDTKKGNVAGTWTYNPPTRSGIASFAEGFASLFGLGTLFRDSRAVPQVQSGTAFTLSDYKHFENHYNKLVKSVGDEPAIWAESKKAIKNAVGNPGANIVRDDEGHVVGVSHSTYIPKEKRTLIDTLVTWAPPVALVGTGLATKNKFWLTIGAINATMLLGGIALAKRDDKHKVSISVAPGAESIIKKVGAQFKYGRTYNILEETLRDNAEAFRNGWMGFAVLAAGMWLGGRGLGKVVGEVSSRFARAQAKETVETTGLRVWAGKASPKSALDEEVITFGKEKINPNKLSAVIGKGSELLKKVGTPRELDVAFNRNRKAIVVLSPKVDASGVITPHIYEQVSPKVAAERLKEYGVNPIYSRGRVSFSTTAHSSKMDNDFIGYSADAGYGGYIFSTLNAMTVLGATTYNTALKFAGDWAKEKGVKIGLKQWRDIVFAVSESLRSLEKVVGYADNRTLALYKRAVDYHGKPMLKGLPPYLSKLDSWVVKPGNKLIAGASTFFVDNYGHYDPIRMARVREVGFRSGEFPDSVFGAVYHIPRMEFFLPYKDAGAIGGVLEKMGGSGGFISLLRKNMKSFIDYTWKSEQSKFSDNIASFMEIHFTKGEMTPELDGFMKKLGFVSMETTTAEGKIVAKGSLGIEPDAIVFGATRETIRKQTIPILDEAQKNVFLNPGIRLQEERIRVPKFVVNPQKTARDIEKFVVGDDLGLTVNKIPASYFDTPVRTSDPPVDLPVKPGTRRPTPKRVTNINQISWWNKVSDMQPTANTRREIKTGFLEKYTGMPEFLTIPLPFQPQWGHFRETYLDQIIGYSWGKKVITTKDPIGKIVEQLDAPLTRISETILPRDITESIIKRMDEEMVLFKSLPKQAQKDVSDFWSTYVDTQAVQKGRPHTPEEVARLNPDTPNTVSVDATNISDLSDADLTKIGEPTRRGSNAALGSSENVDMPESEKRRIRATTREQLKKTRVDEVKNAFGPSGDREIKTGLLDNPDFHHLSTLVVPTWGSTKDEWRTFYRYATNLLDPDVLDKVRDFTSMEKGFLRQYLPVRSKRTGKPIYRLLRPTKNMLDELAEARPELYSRLTWNDENTKLVEDMFNVTSKSKQRVGKPPNMRMVRGAFKEKGIRNIPTGLSPGEWPVMLKIPAPSERNRFPLIDDYFAQLSKMYFPKNILDAIKDGMQQEAKEYRKMYPKAAIFSRDLRLTPGEIREYFSSSEAIVNRGRGIRTIPTGLVDVDAAGIPKRIRGGGITHTTLSIPWIGTTDKEYNYWAVKNEFLRKLPEVYDFSTRERIKSFLMQEEMLWIDRNVINHLESYNKIKGALTAREEMARSSYVRMLKSHEKRSIDEEVKRIESYLEAGKNPGRIEKLQHLLQATREEAELAAKQHSSYERRLKELKVRQAQIKEIL